MRKSLIVGLLTIFFFVGISNVSAQRSAKSGDYRNSIGLGIDFGNGLTAVGPTFKHFFTENHAGVAEVLFGDNYTIIEAFYQYHDQIEGAEGLRWFAGAGIGGGLTKNNSAFLVRPIGGLDYKIPGVPLAFSFDWRPTFFIASDSDFEAARFGLTFRYAFN